MRKLSIYVVLSLGVSLLLAACGGSSDPSTAIRMTMTDFTFSPNTFTVPAGQQISVTATNNGAVAHSFIIMKAHYRVNGHFTDADRPSIYWEAKPLAPGQSVSDEFAAPSEPGEYQIVCGIAGHFEAGMLAQLIVVQQP